MTYAKVLINTPKPYFNLNKWDKIPKVLSITSTDFTKKQCIERNLAILTAHKCEGKTCIVSLKSEEETVAVPEEIIAENLDLDCNVVCIDYITSKVIEVLNRKLAETLCRPRIIISGDSLTKKQYAQAKKTITRISDLFVISIAKMKELFEDVEHHDNIEELLSIVAKDTGAANILLTNGECHLSVVLFNVLTDHKFGFKGNDSNKYYSGSVSTALSANLAHGYNLSQAVYGALEFIQTCKILTRDAYPHQYIHNIEIPLKSMLEDENFEEHEIFRRTHQTELASSEITTNFYAYLTEHPLVKPSWDRYVNHDFVKQISENTLNPSKFKFYIEQDYAYLADFCRIHLITGSKGPDLEDMEDELVIVNRIKGGLEMHRDRLRSFHIPSGNEEEYFANLYRGPALQNYARYLHDVAERGNWKELAIATMPCLTGYVSAAIPYKNKVVAPEGTLYKEWMDVYYSPWVLDAKEKGKQLMNKIAHGCTIQEIQRLAKIYGEVCELEAQFWDAALFHE